jgi:hypothetical protein
MGMSRRHFDSTENVELRAKIDEAKRRLPLPELMRRLGHDEKHIGKRRFIAKCHVSARARYTSSVIAMPQKFVTA